MEFSVFDLMALGTILTCTILSATRGLVSEVIAFGGWLVALIFARVLCVSVADSAFPNMQPREMAIVFAFVLVFIVMRLLLHLVKYGLNRVIQTTKLTYVNRALGGGLGLMKGLFLVTIVVLVSAFTSLPQSESWQAAKTSRFFERMATFATPYLPPFLAAQVVFPERLDDMTDSTSAFSDSLPAEKSPKKRKSTHSPAE